MSEEIAKKKEEELKEFEKQEQEILQSVQDDRCPACTTPTSNIKYINPQIIKLFGWVECTHCGCVYSPLSIRKQKFAIGAANISPQISLIQP